MKNIVPTINFFVLKEKEREDIEIYIGVYNHFLIDFCMTMSMKKKYGGEVLDGALYIKYKRMFLDANICLIPAIENMDNFYDYPSDILKRKIEKCIIKIKKNGIVYNRLLSTYKNKEKGIIWHAWHYFYNEVFLYKKGDGDWNITDEKGHPIPLSNLKKIRFARSLSI